MEAKKLSDAEQEGIKRREQSAGELQTQSQTQSRAHLTRAPRTRGVSPLAFKLAKYSAVGKVTIRNNLAYVYDFVIRTFFLLVIIYIFTQLWGTTFRSVGSSTISGYTYEEIIWYLVFAESLIMASPRLSDKIEQEVKSGDIGYRLTRPMSYLLFHYASYMGEAVVRLLVNICMGGLLGVVLFGWPHFGFGWLGFAIVVIGALTVNYLMSMMVALCSFWVEETKGIEFVYNKLLFTVGGMMLPLETFPATLRLICEWLPFQAVVYFPTKAAVQFDWSMTVRMVLTQAAWVVILSLCLRAMYQKGVRKLNVNGG